VYQASMNISAELHARFDSDAPLLDEDRAMLIELAKNTLASFLSGREQTAKPAIEQQSKDRA